MISASPSLLDLENRAVDINLVPKIYFSFSTDALHSLRPWEYGGNAGDLVCRRSRDVYGKMCLLLICLYSLKQSRKDDLTTVELSWDASVPKLLLQYTA